MQRWNENQFDEEQYPGPDETPIANGFNMYISGLQFGKGSFGLAAQQAADLVPNTFHIGTELHSQIEKIEPPTVAKPPHSMTPYAGQVFDRRGRKLY